MTIEEKEIGLGLELEEGTFESVTLTEDGVLVLQENPEPIGQYITEGYWESEVIDLQYKFKEFKKISLTSNIPDSSQVGIEVRMSDSGSDFTPYQQTAEDGTFQSPARRFIQVKINLYAGYTALNNIIDFKEKESLEEIQKSYYFESTEDGLKINSNETIAIPMELDEEYTGDGYVYVAELEKDEFITETITKLDIL